MIDIKKDLHDILGGVVESIDLSNDLLKLNEGGRSGDSAKNYKKIAQKGNIQQVKQAINSMEKMFKKEGSASKDNNYQHVYDMLKSRLEELNKNDSKTGSGEGDGKDSTDGVETQEVEPSKDGGEGDGKDSVDGVETQEVEPVKDAGNGENSDGGDAEPEPQNKLKFKYVPMSAVADNEGIKDIMGLLKEGEHPGLKLEDFRSDDNPWIFNAFKLIKSLAHGFVELDEIIKGAGDKIKKDDLKISFEIQANPTNDFNKLKELAKVEGLETFVNGTGDVMVHLSNMFKSIGKTWLNYTDVSKAMAEIAKAELKFEAAEAEFEYSNDSSKIISSMPENFVKTGAEFKDEPKEKEKKPAEGENKDALKNPNQNDDHSEMDTAGSKPAAETPDEVEDGEGLTAESFFYDVAATLLNEVENDI